MSTPTLYAAFEATVIAAACGWALWHTATRVLKLKLGRRVEAGAAGGCGGCGGCGGGHNAPRSCSPRSITPAPHCRDTASGS